MRTASLSDLIAATDELAVLPVSVVRLLELLDDLTVDAQRVLAIVEKDPALSANLLKLCNSGYYGLQRKIGTPREALVLLGNRTVMTLAFASGMGDLLRGPMTGYGMGREDMWRHSLATALGAAYLADETGASELRERAFTAGLVHDLGKLLLNRQLIEETQQLPQSVASGAIGESCSSAGQQPVLTGAVPPVTEGEKSTSTGTLASPEEMFDDTLPAAERNLLGYDHCEAGAALAEAWNFPPMLVEAIRFHHRPRAAEADRELVRVVAAADIVAKSLGLGSQTTALVGADELRPLTDYGIPMASIIYLLEHLADDVENLTSACSGGQPQ